MLETEFEHWSGGNTTLRCVGIHNETHDVKTFIFSAEREGRTVLFLHKPGQFVTIRLTHHGQLVARSYTIASSPTMPFRLQLTIKRDPNGLVSRFMHDQFHIGDLLLINGPAGQFNLMDTKPRKNILMLSAGSGITPLMSMLRYLQGIHDSNHRVTFLHSARTPQDIIFQEELNSLQRHSHVNIGYICERNSLPNMKQGFLTKEYLLSQVPDILEYTIACCGPAPYMNAVKRSLVNIGFDFTHYHEESFGDPAERKNPDGATPKSLTNTAVSAENGNTTTLRKMSSTSAPTSGSIVTFAVSSKTANFSAGETLLDIASREGIAIPTNCQMGLCGTCKTKCSSGNIIMDETEGLTDEEIALGYVLTCCGRPEGPVTIEF